jgi:hypothetical protein
VRHNSNPQPSGWELLHRNDRNDRSGSALHEPDRVRRHDQLRMGDNQHDDQLPRRVEERRQAHAPRCDHQPSVTPPAGVMLKRRPNRVLMDTLENRL